MEAHKGQISEHVHSLKIPFKVKIASGKEMERFVYVHLIYAEKIFLIDTGVSGSKELIFNYIRETGRSPDEISMAIITHAHPDHIGGAHGLVSSTGCVVAAHADDISWIEDVELQLSERPVPNFHRLVEASVKVDRALTDGDILELDSAGTLKVVHTPGHARGHIALYYERDGVLISGDCVPVPGGLPIYDDVIESIESIKKLKNLAGVKALISSWDEPRYGQEIPRSFDNGIDYIKRIHEEVIRQAAVHHTSDAGVIARGICKSLGLPEMVLTPLFFRTVAAHLGAGDRLP